MSVNSAINSTAGVECPMQLRLWSVPWVEAWLLVLVRMPLKQMVCRTMALYGLHHILVSIPSVRTGKWGYLGHAGLFGMAYKILCVDFRMVVTNNGTTNKS